MNIGFDHAEDYDSNIDNYDEVTTVKETAFQKWFKTFLEEKGVDLSEFLASDIQVGDVCQKIYNTTPEEQAKIKTVIVKIDFKDGDVNHFFKHLAGSFKDGEVEKQRAEMTDAIFGAN